MKNDNVSELAINKTGQVDKSNPSFFGGRLPRRRAHKSTWTSGRSKASGSHPKLSRRLPETSFPPEHLVQISIKHLLTDATQQLVC